MVKSNLAKLMKEKKLTYRRLSKLFTLDALAKVLDVKIKDLFDED